MTVGYVLRELVCFLSVGYLLHTQTWFAHKHVQLRGCRHGFATKSSPRESCNSKGAAAARDKILPEGVRTSVPFCCEHRCQHDDTNVRDVHCIADRFCIPGDVPDRFAIERHAGSPCQVAVTRKPHARCLLPRQHPTRPRRRPPTRLPTPHRRQCIIHTHAVELWSDAQVKYAACGVCRIRAMQVHPRGSVLDDVRLLLLCQIRRSSIDFLCFVGPASSVQLGGQFIRLRLPHPIWPRADVLPQVHR